MKAQISIVHKYITISLLVIYVVVALMYIVSLPPNNHADGKLNPSSPTEFFNKNTSSGNTATLLHRGIRSTIENKQKILIPVTTASIIYFFFLFGNLALLGLSKKGNTYLSLFYSPQRNSYLSLRTLRI